MPEDIQHQNDVEAARERLRKGKEAETEEGKELVQAPPPSPEDIQKQKERMIRKVKGKSKKKKTSQKLKEALFSEDIGDGSITEHIVFKILIPSLKKIVFEMGNNALAMVLNLQPGTRILNGDTHVANASTYRDRNFRRIEAQTGVASRRRAVSEFEWDEEDARDIFNQLSDLIDQFGFATLSDAYTIMDKGELVRSTDRHWGWTSMGNADVYEVRPGCWIVDMPPVKAV